MDHLLVPLLNNSCEYYRGVGYFTSGWLAAAAEGVASLAEHGGHARFVVSPLLNEKDLKALEVGDRARRDEALKALLERHVSDIRSSIRQDTLNVLAWLVADGVLDFRIAVPRRAHGGDYHDKVGVFTDDRGDEVAIHGSFNDTAKGTLNGEAFSVFASWLPGQAAYVERHRSRLRSLWNNGNSQFHVHELPEAVARQLIELRTSNDPPYPTPSRSRKGPARAPDTVPAGDAVQLRPYQNEAVDAWVANRWSGIFEMATGTGKTFTALAAAQRRKTETGRLALLILVPYQHLLHQWEDAARSFGFSPLLCSSAFPKWRQSIVNGVQDFRRGGLQHFCVIAVQDTAAGEEFDRLIGRLPDDLTMLIADEVHGLGASCRRKALRPEVTCRLGLSATPDRWFDEEGTAVLSRYFGGTVFEFPMSEAIGRYLVPYEYFPITLELEPEELAEYETLSARIAVLGAKLDDRTALPDEMKMLLIKRSRVIGGASGKIPLLLQSVAQLIGEHETTGSALRHTLVYCAPGTHRSVLQEVSALGLRVHEFVSHVPLPRRQELLKQFQAGEIQALVAINCLDEGVDVPATQTAFFLASTTNPRQFVQRRGRILRMAQGKQKARIYDFVVVPGRETVLRNRELAMSILRREMARFSEFSSLALNEFEARSRVRPILDACEALHLLDERPWEIMRQMKLSDEWEHAFQTGPDALEQ